MWEFPLFSCSFFFTELDEILHFGNHLFPFSVQRATSKSNSILSNYKTEINYDFSEIIYFISRAARYNNIFIERRCINKYTSNCRKSDVDSFM